MVNLSALLIVGLTTAQAATSPPWFPSPEVGTVVTDLRWKAALEKAQQTVANMTLPEKVNVTTGVGWEMGMCVGNTGAVERLGIKSFCLQDGPLGVRLTDKVTVLSRFSRLAFPWPQLSPETWCFVGAQQWAGRTNARA